MVCNELFVMIISFDFSQNVADLEEAQAYKIISMEAARIVAKGLMLCEICLRSDCSSVTQGVQHGSHLSDNTRLISSGMDSNQKWLHLIKMM